MREIEKGSCVGLMRNSSDLKGVGFVEIINLSFFK